MGALGLVVQVAEPWAAFARGWLAYLSPPAAVMPLPTYWTSKLPVNRGLPISLLVGEGIGGVLLGLLIAGLLVGRHTSSVIQLSGDGMVLDPGTSRAELWAWDRILPPKGAGAVSGLTRVWVKSEGVVAGYCLLTARQMRAIREYRGNASLGREPAHTSSSGS
jgi:hypothetical protein